MPVPPHMTNDWGLEDMSAERIDMVLTQNMGDLHEKPEDAQKMAVTFLNAIGDSQTTETLGNVQEEGKKLFVAYLTRVFKDGASKSTFRRTGELSPLEMLCFYAALPWLNDPTFADLSMEADPGLLDAVTLIATTPATLPLATAEAVVMFVANCALCLQWDGRPQPLPSLQPIALRQGLLAKFYDIVTTFAREPDIHRPCLGMSDSLINELGFVKRHFKPNKPNRLAFDRALAAVLALKDSDGELVKDLKEKMQTLGAYIEDLHETEEKEMKGMCRRCSISSTATAPIKLKRCSRCNSALYCSAACQKADWGVRKKHCERVVETEACPGKDLKAAQTIVYNLIKQNMDQIVDEMTALSKDAEIDVKDMVIRIDLKRVPAKPKVVLLKDILSKKELPADWFSYEEFREFTESNIAVVLNNMREMRSQLVEGQVMALCRKPGESNTVLIRIKMQRPDGTNVFTNASLKNHMVDSVRRLLNARFGADFPVGLNLF